MAVKIDSALTLNDYQRITEALRNEWKVIILDEQKLESPMALLDPVYVNAKKNGRYYIDSKVYLDSTKAASTVQVYARKKFEERYDVTGSNHNFTIEGNGNEYRLNRPPNDRSNTLLLTSSENDVDTNFLKQDIPAYLQILETLIDSGYSHYNISRERKFPTIINIFKESDRKRQPPEKKKTKEEVTTIAALEYTPKDLLTTGFDDIGGCTEAKTALKRFMYGLNHTQVFEERGAKQPTGLLLYGLPGTGKTLLARAAAKEGDANFYNVNMEEVTDMWYGESEKNVKEIFRIAQNNAPAVIFMDEMDSLFHRRDRSEMDVDGRVISALLTAMDGLKKLKGVLVMGATNRPDALDPALLRPGRFDKLIEVPMPDLAAREKIFQIQVNDRKISEKYLEADIDYRKLAESSEGLSGAGIDGAVTEATDKIMDLLMEGIEPGPLSTDGILEGIKAYRISRDKINQVMPKDVSAHLYA